MHPMNRFIKLYGRLPTEFDPDYLEILNMSKYRILAVPDIKPAKCANCGSSKNDGRKYIDFGLEVDWYGIVYLCGLCLVDVATEMGLFDHLKNRIKETEIKLLNIQQTDTKGIELRDNFLKIFEEVQNYASSLPTSSISTPANSGSVPDNAETTKGESSKLPVDSVKRTTNETEQRVTKSAAIARSSNLPRIADLLDT